MTPTIEGLNEIPKPIGDFILSQKDIKAVESYNGHYYHYSNVCTLLKRFAASLNRQGWTGEDYKLAPEETELIDVWRQARAAVKNSKFSIADERLEHCKRILGDSNDYWMPLPNKPSI